MHLKYGLDLVSLHDIADRNHRNDEILGLLYPDEIAFHVDRTIEI